MRTELSQKDFSPVSTRLGAALVKPIIAIKFATYMLDPNYALALSLKTLHLV